MWDAGAAPAELCLGSAHHWWHPDPGRVMRLQCGLEPWGNQGLCGQESMAGQELAHLGMSCTHKERFESTAEPMSRVCSHP